MPIFATNLYESQFLSLCLSTLLDIVKTNLNVNVVNLDSDTTVTSLFLVIDMDHKSLLT